MESKLLLPGIPAIFVRLPSLLQKFALENAQGLRIIPGQAASILPTRLPGQQRHAQHHDTFVHSLCPTTKGVTTKIISLWTKLILRTTPADVRQLWWNYAATAVVHRSNHQ